MSYNFEIKNQKYYGDEMHATLYVNGKKVGKVENPSCVGWYIEFDDKELEKELEAWAKKQPKRNLFGRMVKLSLPEIISIDWQNKSRS